MTTQPLQTTRVTFVDFLYAVVVGSTFQFLAPFEVSFRLFALLFLILVILEDFYLFHTQITAEVPNARASFLPLVLELSILIAWYFSVISVTTSARICLLAFASFFLLKWLAAVAHRRSVGQLRGWRLHRSHAFLIPSFVSFLLAWLFGRGPLNHPLVCVAVIMSWGFYVLIWWSITREHETEDEPI
jgi:hypothetical protein